MNYRQIKFARGRVFRVARMRFRKLAGSKRQRLISAVILLSLGLFVSEYLLGKSGIFVVFGLSFLTDFLLLLALFSDLQENFSITVFILPFFYSLSFGLFYLLVPARFLTRIFMTTLYGIGLYSLFLSQNIFTVSAIRTIQLLSGARTVSFTISLISYFFLTNVIFSLHSNLFITLALIILETFPMVVQSIWTYTLDNRLLSNLIWSTSLTALISEISIILWFWPSSPTMLALFLTGVFYTVVSLTQAWFERRLFRALLVEYAWVAAVIFGVLILFTFFY